jgi:hypothetical protein
MVVFFATVALVMDGTATTPLAHEGSNLAPLPRAVLNLYIELCDASGEACISQDDLQREFRRFDWESIDFARDRLIHLRHLVRLPSRRIWGVSEPVFKVHHTPAPRASSKRRRRLRRRRFTDADFTETHAAILLSYRLNADANGIAAITQRQLYDDIQHCCAYSQMLDARSELIDAGLLVRVGSRIVCKGSKSKGTLVQTFRVDRDDVSVKRLVSSVNPTFSTLSPLKGTL